MAYNPNIPQVTDILSQSQADILGNFQALSPFLNGVTNFAAIFPVLSSTPTTSSSEVSLFSALDGSGNQQLYYGPPSSGTPINLTGSAGLTDGWAYLPSGILLKWGTTTCAVNTLSTITLPVLSSTPVFNYLFYVSAAQTFAASPTTSTLNTSVSAGNFTATTFQVWPNATTAPLTGTVSIVYFAIGA
jgi:hypothetical protein